MTASTLIQQPGRLVSDTKNDLVLDPGRFLLRTLDLWDSSASFGRIQNQAVGYWFPMGPFFWLGDTLTVPGWVTQRLWWSVILVVALWGLVKLAEAFDIGTNGSRLIAAVLFATGPAMLVELGTRSPNTLPLALVPFALLPLVHGARHGSVRRAACASAIVVIAMGGVNATATGAALIVPVIYLLTRTPGPRRRGLTAWWIAAVSAGTFWWWGALLLQQRYSFDILQYTEDAATTTAGMSLTEVLRGTGFWLVRLRVGPDAWLPTGLLLIANTVAVLGTVAAAALGLAGLADRRLPERAFLALTLAAGVGLMGAGYAGELGGPVAGLTRELLDGPFAIMRNVHKLAPLVALPLALGAAQAGAVAAAALRHRRVAGWPRWPVTSLVGLGIASLVIAVSLPLSSTEIAQTRSFDEVPSYWRDASRWLNGHTGGEGVLLVPASAFPSYTWGQPTDEPFQALLDGPWAVRDIIPFGGLRSTRLLDGFEELFDDRRTPRSLAASLARSGIGWVVVRNDLDPSRSTAPDPTFVLDAMDRAPGLTRVAGFGPRADLRLDRTRLTPTLGRGISGQAIEVYEVGQPIARVSTYDLDSSLAVAGNAETVQLLDEQGLLEGRGVLLVGDDEELAARAGRRVITDDFRLRDVAFSRVHDDTSYTLQPGEQAPDEGRDPVDRRVPGDARSLTHVDFLGARSVTASSYFSGFARLPGFQPYAAIDGDPGTGWHVAAFRDPEDEWWRVQLDEPVNVASITIRLPRVPDNAGFISRVRVTTDGGSVDGSFASPDDVLRLDLPDGPTREVKVTVVEARQTIIDLLTLGIAEISLAGASPINRVLVTPEAPGDDPVAVVLARDAGDPFDATADAEDQILDRQVALPAGATYALSGTAVAVPGPELTALVARLHRGDPGEPSADATSTWADVPAFAPDQALDGDRTTSWLADPTDPFPALALRWNRPRRIAGLHLTFPGRPALRPDHVKITVDFRTTTVPVESDGTVRFRPVVTDTIGISPDVADMDGRSFGLVGLAEVDVFPGARPRRAADPATRPGPSDVQVTLPCGSGPTVEIDGAAVPTRVRGTLREVRQIQPMAMEACDPVTIGIGDHRITGPVTGAFQAESIVLDPLPSLDPPHNRASHVESWTNEQREVRIAPGGRTALLALAENRNAGWVATLNGRRLRPTTVDGWRQAWVVPPGDGGVVHIAFRAGVLYDRLLVAGLLLALLVVGCAALPDRRQRQDRVSAPPRRVADIVLVLGTTAAVALAAGLVAVVVPVMWLAVRRSWVRAAIAVTAMLLIGTLMVTDSTLPGPEFSAIGQLLGGLAVAASLAPTFRGSGEPNR